MSKGVAAQFSLGFNHDEGLIDVLARINNSSIHGARIREVFGSLRGAPVASARPEGRLPILSEELFAKQIANLKRCDIDYNFVLNAGGEISRERLAAIHSYLCFLSSCGVSRVTVGTPELARYVRGRFPKFHITMSITFGIDSVEKMQVAQNSGVDAMYLQPVTVNRDFKRLRDIVSRSSIECRLYANVSCISDCPVVDAHYASFRHQGPLTKSVNDSFFAACSQIKLANPTEWIQMPWIRPEDLAVYGEIGIQQFKLSDRLSSTEVLTLIAESYVMGRSPRNLFQIIERGVDKFKVFSEDASEFFVDSRVIGDDFIGHFVSGECRSRNIDCVLCRSVAKAAVKVTASVRNKASLALSVREFRAMRERLDESVSGVFEYPK